MISRTAWWIQTGGREYFTWELENPPTISKKTIYNIEGQWVMKDYNRLIPIVKIENKLSFNMVGPRRSPIARKQKEK